MSIFLDDKKPVIEPEKENTQIPAAEQAPAAGDSTSAETAAITVETIDVQAQENEKRINDQLENLWASGKEQLTDTNRPKQVEPTTTTTTNTAPINNVAQTVKKQPVIEEKPSVQIAKKEEVAATAEHIEQPTALPLQQEVQKDASITKAAEHTDLPAVQKDHSIVAQENHENTEPVKKKTVKK